MNRYVIDASVAVKWFVPEVHSDTAARLLDGTYELIAPDLLLPEFANILWKKVRLGQISSAVGRQIMQEFKAVCLQTYPPDDLLEQAFEIANNLGRTVYDSLYLALAIREQCQLVTADQKFYNALATSSFAVNILWIEDV